MSGLREALERLLVTMGGATTVSTSTLRNLLAAHPAEPAPVASRERVAEVLAKAFHQSDSNTDEWYELDPIAQVAYLDEATQCTDALLAAGVFRDEAQVKAEAVAGWRAERRAWAAANGYDIESAGEPS